MASALQRVGLKRSSFADVASATPPTVRGTKITQAEADACFLLAATRAAALDADELLRHGASLYAVDSKNNNALHLAMKSHTLSRCGSFSLTLPAPLHADLPPPPRPLAARWPSTACSARRSSRSAC